MGNPNKSKPKQFRPAAIVMVGCLVARQMPQTQLAKSLQGTQCPKNIKSQGRANQLRASKHKPPIQASAQQLDKGLRGDVPTARAPSQSLPLARSQNSSTGLPHSRPRHDSIDSQRLQSQSNSLDKQLPEISQHLPKSRSRDISSDRPLVNGRGSRSRDVQRTAAYVSLLFASVVSV